MAEVIGHPARDGPLHRMPLWHSQGVSEQEQERRRAGVGSPRRLEALVDGAFAIVMTIIVVEITVPEGPASELGAQLLQDVPTLLSYGLVFLTLGTLWFGNRSQTEYIRHADHPYVWLNLLMLLLVAFVPFSAGFLVRFPAERISVVLFGVHLVAIQLAHAGVWIYATGRSSLLRDGVTERFRRGSRFPALTPSLGYAAATLLGLAWPTAGLIGYVLVPVPFVTGLYYRWLDSLTREPGDRASRDRLPQGPVV